MTTVYLDFRYRFRFLLVFSILQVSLQVPYWVSLVYPWVWFSVSSDIPLASVLSFFRHLSGFRSVFFRKLSGVLGFFRHQFSFRPQVPCLLSYWLRRAFSLLQLYRCTAPSLPQSRVFLQVLHCMLLPLQPNEWRFLNQGSNISCNNYCQYVNKQRKTKRKTG